MLGITLKELDVWRQETRRETGVHVSSADTTDVEQEENSKLVELAT